MGLDRLPDTSGSGRGGRSVSVLDLRGVQFRAQHDDVVDVEFGRWSMRLAWVLATLACALGLGVIGLCWYVVSTSPQVDAISKGFWVGVPFGLLLCGLLIRLLPRRGVTTFDGATTRRWRCHIAGITFIACPLVGQPAVAILSGQNAGLAFSLSFALGVATVGSTVYFWVAHHRLYRWTCPCCGNLRFAPHDGCCNCNATRPDHEDVPSLV